MYDDLDFYDIVEHQIDPAHAAWEAECDAHEPIHGLGSCYPFGPEGPPRPRPDLLAEIERLRGPDPFELRVAEHVGGVDAWCRLVDLPLPDEPFEWVGLDPDAGAVAGRVLRLAESWTDQHGDAELRTIVRRIVRRGAQSTTSPLARWAPERTAAAIIWIVLAGNFVFSRKGRWTASSVWDFFDVQRSVDQALILAGELGFRPPSQRWPRNKADEVVLGNPDLLHSDSRRHLMRRRFWLELHARDELERIEKMRPIRHRPDGTVVVRALQAEPLLTVKASLDGGETAIVVAFGDDPDQASVFAIEPDAARALARQLRSALHGPPSASVA